MRGSRRYERLAARAFTAQIYPSVREERGFHALATIDRIAYPSHDSLTVLAAAAGATSRIGLATNILLGPAYPPTLLAQANASLASLSGGRFTLEASPPVAGPTTTSSPDRTSRDEARTSTPSSSCCIAPGRGSRSAVRTVSSHPRWKRAGFRC